MAEIWKAIPGWNGAYEASDAGRIRSLRNQSKLLMATVRPDGHLQVTLSADGRRKQYLVHQLVLMAFSGPRPKGQETRHLNGIAHDNRAANLCWGTRGENMADRKLLGEENPARGEAHGRAKFCEDDVRYIRRLYKKGQSFGQIAKHIGASRNAVGKVCMGKTWRHVQ